MKSKLNRLGLKPVSIEVIAARPNTHDAVARKLLHALREFGYPKLTLIEVEAALHRYRTNALSETNVIDALVKSILDHP